jgi:hypothetical protein
MKSKITVCIFCILVGLPIHFGAQNSFSSSGGNLFGSGGSVSFSMGQLFYDTSFGAKGILSKGVQQAYEIWLVTDQREQPFANLSVIFYPNPTPDYLQLHLESPDITGFSFQLTDASGKVLQYKHITTTDTQIDMRKLSSAMYFLKIISGRQEIRLFKIIKN